MNFLPFPNGEGLAAMPAPRTGNAFAPRRLPVAEQPKKDAAVCPGFDAEAALCRVDGNRELLRQMAGLFAMQWRKLADEIASAGRRRDGATLELAAHTLDRSVRSFGADEASRVAQELEARACNADFHDLEETCVRLKIEVERLVRGLKEFANEMVPSTSR
jgi:HPt (histidine-containing phosphotransfer) domain-containing protein